MNSPPSNSATYQSEPGYLSSDRKPAWFLPLLFFGALITFVLFTGGNEIARWHNASARNAIEDGRFEDAVDAANKGLKWKPKDRDLIALRAAAHLETGNFEACLGDYDMLIEIGSADEVVNEADMQPLAAKASVLQRIDRYPEAIAILDEVVEYRRNQYRWRDDADSQYAFAMALNNRAYIQAQGWTLDNDSVDIKESLGDIRLAMEVRGKDDDAVMIDTLGYLLLLNGELEEAKEELENAVELTRKQNELLKNRYEMEMQNVVDQRPYEVALEQLDQQMSVILHHRGEVYEALGEQEKADTDIEEAKQLGFNPDEGVW